MKKNPLLKVVILTLSGIAVLWIIHCIFVNSFGFRLNMSGNLFGRYYRGGMNMGNSFINGGNLTNILMIITRILFVGFTIGIIGAIFSWVKNNVFTAEDKENIKNIFAGNAKVDTKKTCTECGKEIKTEWKLCPHCGKEVTPVVINEVKVDNL